MAKSGAEPDHLDQLQDELIASDAAISDRVRASRGGGKLNRTETVTVRLDPKLNYLCELAARAQRRTKSSFIEWAIEHALDDVALPGERGGPVATTIADRSTELWDVEEPDRLIALAFWAPALLTHEEQVIWKLISTSGFFWIGHWDNSDDWEWDISLRRNLVAGRVHDNWEAIKAVAEGTEAKSANWIFNRLKKDRNLVQSGQDFGKNSTAGAAGFDPDLDDCPF